MLHYFRVCTLEFEYNNVIPNARRSFGTSSTSILNATTSSHDHNIHKLILIYVVLAG